ncbi:sporulation protein YqfC [Clostridium cylindrosporum]|uniref:Sporulation protein YqfC n=1 Tax=Clostridium cylindrosporum DSM 605 TaxID=1121307 RepID=A0A0J8G1L7_CLOCY|nr:sporulation protein YqfC [Clostridium cylindrosporum]KMT21651.1 sporulation protein YqfC [Clostridium cylindrosporum DSM 605]
MVKKSSVKEKVTEKLSLPKDIVLNMPNIKILGDKEVLIENHGGIIEYTADVVKLKSSLGEILIKGEGFQIKDISEDDIYILGKIDSLGFIK